MNVFTLHREQLIPRPIDEVFAFFADAANLQRITPAWMHFRILTPQPITLAAGALLDYRIRWHWLPIRWTTRIEEWNPPYRFVDTQLRGPYRLWHHTHEFESVGEATRMRDTVRYALPFGPLGRLMHSLTVQRDVESIFNFRTEWIGNYFRQPLHEK